MDVSGLESLWWLRARGKKERYEGEGGREEEEEEEGDDEEDE